MSYSNYFKVLERSAGDTWAVKFKREEHPININVPPLIPSEKIKKAIQMRRFNATSNRHDVKNNYLLSGFVRCDVCEKVLIGQTQKYPKSGNKYRYYRHKQNPGVTCNALTSIPGNSIEQAVLEAIWENVIDEQGFEASLTEMLPDKNDRLELVNKIDTTELALKSTDQRLSKLADAVIEGILTKETIKAKESELLKEKALLNSALSKKKSKLSRMADPAMVAEEARQVRLILLDQFGSAQHFIKMGFDQRRRLLHTMFDGEDEEGKKRGVYIKRLGRCKFEYHILTTAFEGIRVMFNRDFDYYNEDDPEMPEYQIRDKLKDLVGPKGKVRTKVNHSDIGSGDSSIERLVEINGIRRKRKFRDNK